MNDKTISASNALLQALIRCASVTPTEAGVLDVLEAYLSKNGFSCTRLRFSGDGSYPVDNLFASIGEGGRHILFGGHTDVVPPGDEAIWAYGPFDGEIADGVMYGRGAVDMKSGVAAFAVAAVEAAQLVKDHPGRISLAITNDEEADSVNGTKKIMQWAEEQGHYFDFAIVGEPSSRAEFGDSIKIGRRGSLSGRISVTGAQGHSAYPQRARNPVPVASAIALALQDHLFDEGSEHFQPTNLEVTSLDVGNTASNVIPSSASLMFNVRYNDHWTDDTLRDEIDQIIASVDHRNCPVSWRRIGAVAQCFISPVSADVHLVSDAIEAATGKKPELATFGGTSDARFIANYCPVIECGLVGTTMHQTDERVPLDEVDALTDLYGDVLRRFFTR